MWNGLKPIKKSPKSLQRKPRSTQVAGRPSPAALFFYIPALFERKVMKWNIMKWMVLSLVVFFTASLSLADDEKVLKVFVFKVKKGSTNVTPLTRFDVENVELVMPTDEQMKEARKTVEGMNLKQGDLKQVNQSIPLEVFVLQVEKVYKDQPITPDDLVNGIAVMKPTDQELDQQKEILKQLQEIADVLHNFEFQMASGGAPALTPLLGNSYHLGNTFCFGLGYQFTPFFDTLINVEVNDFPPEPAIANGGFEYTSTLAELLFKFRLTPDGIRPYLFFGPAASQNNFGGSFNYKSLTGTVNYESQSDFAMVGGLGFEFPLGSMHFFLQGEVVYNFIDIDTANWGTLDQPSVFVPIQLGIVFGK
jgi:hypothetical protein